MGAQRGQGPTGSGTTGSAGVGRVSSVTDGAGQSRKGHQWSAGPRAGDAMRQAGPLARVLAARAATGPSGESGGGGAGAGDPVLMGKRPLQNLEATPSPKPCSSRVGELRPPRRGFKRRN